MNVSGHYSQLV